MIQAKDGGGSSGRRAADSEVEGNRGTLTTHCSHILECVTTKVQLDAVVRGTEGLTCGCDDQVSPSEAAGVTEALVGSASLLGPGPFLPVFRLTPHPRQGGRATALGPPGLLSSLLPAT